VLWLAAILAFVAVVAAACSSGGPSAEKHGHHRKKAGSSAPPVPAAPSGSVPAAAPALTGRMFTVTSYGGCKGDGTTNCYSGVQDAINAAQSAGGGTVYFPAGTYVDGLHKPWLVQGTAVNFAGANPGNTIIVPKTPDPTLLTVKASHVTIQNLTFNSSAVHGGKAVVQVIGSYDSVLACRILGAPGTSWPLRFAGGSSTHATPNNPHYSTGNRIDGLFIHDYAPSRNDGLDFPFQQDGSISNVQQIGSRLGLYVDRNVTVTNYTYSPEPSLKDGTFGYYITPPATTSP
jgi:hypothetical protein